MWGGVGPSSVEIITSSRCTWVTMNYPIRIKHGDYLNSKIRSQKLSMIIIWYKLFHKSPHNIGSHSFRWMCSRNHNNGILHRFLFHTILWWNHRMLPIFNKQYLIFQYCIANFKGIYKSVLLDVLQILSQIWIAIGIRVSKINPFLFFCEC